MSGEIHDNPLEHPSGNFNQDLVASLNYERAQHEKLDAERAKVEESPEEKKERIDGLWSEFQKVRSNAQLMTLFDRQASAPPTPSEELLKLNQYPERTKVTDLEFDTWQQDLNPKFVKDGYMYVFRGDYSGQDSKGFYTRPYGYGKKSTAELVEELSSPSDTPYYLYRDPSTIKYKAKDEEGSIAESLANWQSMRGASSFISTTTSIESAAAGTGNTPTPEDKEKFVTYLLKIPVDSILKSNTGNHYGMEEDEFIVPDFISPTEIVRVFEKDAGEDIYNYLRDEVGLNIERSDIRLK